MPFNNANHAPRRTPARRRPGAIRGLMIAGFMLIAGVLGWLLHGTYAPAPAQPATTAKLPSLGKAPSYRLTNQVGREVSSKQFRGKVRLVTYLFPYCDEYCPLIAAHLAEFHNIIADTRFADKVQFVAFNVGPKDTGPKQMRIFLQQYGWQPKDSAMQFLTGTPKQVRRVVTGGFHIAYQRVSEDSGDEGTIEVKNALAERVKPGYDISHNDALEVVDPQGRIRKIYSAADRVTNQQLLDVVSALASK
jgi:cytochrome oxidase Cu insertion factor (SCO1/SenC/PrrC family)